MTEDTALSDLPNIGKKVEEQLVLVGIRNPGELRKIGAKKAWLKILAIDESACINRLMALEGAIRNMKKSLLPDEVKSELKDFCRQYKKS